MSLQSIANQFVELCNNRKNFDVMHTMYAPDIVSVEGDGSETAGQAQVIQKSERWAASNTIHGETVRGPYFNGPDEFAVHITFEVTPKATGQRVAREEVAVYTVKGDKITRERFFYAGSW
jgi:ketosteroid isomerase-like protein